MTSFRDAVSRTVGKMVAQPAPNTKMPNPQRFVSESTAQKQMEKEVPFRITRDTALTTYINQYSLKAAGIGFVTPPYSSLFDRIWGIVPTDDLPKLQALYDYNPFIAACVDIRVNLSVSPGFELEGGNSTFRDYLEEWVESHRLLETMRIQETDAYVNGFSVTEICRDEDGQRVEWLKPLEPAYMRVRRDAYDNVFGWIQLESVPPVVFKPQQILKTTHNSGSGRWNRQYGRSLLRASLYIQNLIDDFQHDMTMIMKVYSKPILALICGSEKSPWSDEKLNQFIDDIAARTQATDLALRHDVQPVPIPSMTSNLKVDWYLDWLEKQRDAQLGVPKIFLGIPEGTNRATADIVMQEFITRLKTRQNQNKAIYETELFPAILEGDFQGSLITPGKIPKIKPRPIWEPPADVLTDQQIKLFNAALIGDVEARTKLGLPEQVVGNLKQIRDNVPTLPRSAISQTNQDEE